MQIMIQLMVNFSTTTTGCRQIGSLLSYRADLRNIVVFEENSDLHLTLT
ncbi:hypothetical protein [Paenibacillus eucommiae]|uniref:Uncharacterized protein n=1 Tax=Paenibacillus eucommiae TaxID=1355755 RepID=A0ABS4JCD9_9BACL|nr:hypothetical protein [Paenibacillus eucommiae]MBP1996731.1 hypothetical protein [Paenibacillus eucommiae]